MDPYMETLFEEAEPFEEGEVSEDPQYDYWTGLSIDLEKKLRELLYSEEEKKLLSDFIEVSFEIERYQCLHYFLQGYLAAKEEQEP